MPGLLQAVNNLMNWNSSSESSSQEKVYFYYSQIVSQARNPVFYDKLGVPDTLEGRFDCLSLHMALLLMVLKSQDAQSLSQNLFDLFFADVDRNLREIGVGDLSVGRQVKKLASNFYGVLQAYEEGLKQEPMLAKALVKNLYGDASVSSENLKILINYIQGVIGVLTKISFKTEESQISWPELR